MYDVYLLRINASGDTFWTKTYGGTANDDGHSLLRTSDGGYIIAGSTASFGAGSYDIYLIKTNSLGDTLWTRTYGGSREDRCGDFSSVQQTSDGGYIVTGLTFSFGAGDRDIYLIKTDAGGGTVWTKTFGSTAADEGNTVIQTSDGGYFITGPIFRTGTEDVLLIKTDANGNVSVDEERYDARCKKQEAGLKILQNPTRRNVQFTIKNSKWEITSIKIYDVAGKLVKSFTLSSLPSAPCALPFAIHLSAGVYFIKAKIEDKEFIEKIVVMK